MPLHRTDRRTRNEGYAYVFHITLVANKPSFFCSHICHPLRSAVVCENINKDAPITRFVIWCYGCVEYSNCIRERRVTSCSKCPLERPT